MGLRETTGIGGAAILILGVGMRAARIWSRIDRDTRPSSAQQAQDREEAAEHAMWKPHITDLFAHVDAPKHVHDYLDWGVSAYHEEADNEAMNAYGNQGVIYRDGVIKRIHDRARSDNRTDVLPVLDKLEAQVKKLPTDKWWELPTPAKKKA